LLTKDVNTRALPQKDEPHKPLPMGAVYGVAGISNRRFKPGNNDLAPRFTGAPGPTRLPEEVSTHSHRPKRRHLWEKNGKKDPFPGTGSHLWDRKIGSETSPVLAIDQQSKPPIRKHESLWFRSQQFEIIRDGRRRVFCTRAYLSIDKFFRLPAPASRQI
jgi:hypothetical protein